MGAMFWVSLLNALWLIATNCEEATVRPNIIFMFGDDIGFNELGYHDCTETATPFIDDLATKESLILFHNYVNKVCGPSRASLLTGRYPSHLGLQNLVFNPQYPVSLTRQVSLLSNEFKHAGYSTHIIGKWHLGMQSWEYTPRYRGFDTFSGFYGGWQTYFSHEQHILGPNGVDVNYYDLRVDEEECTDAVEDGVYGVWWERDQALKLLATLKEEQQKHYKPFFLYLAWQASHTPNEAPQEYVDMYGSTEQAVHPFRVFSQAQTTTLDIAIKDVVLYLKQNDLWQNTLLVFSSDNGGEINRGDNYPLRGYKNQSWEGGIRTPAFVTGGYLNDERRGEVLTNTIVHITDWYPTLLEAAGVDAAHIKSKKLHNTQDEDVRFETNGVGKIHLDGKSVWRAIQFDETNEEISVDSREILLDLNDEYCEFSSCGALRSGHWKFLRGASIGTVKLAVSGEEYKNGDQWQRVFATCSQREDRLTQNVLGCEELVSSNAVGCHLEETGCLFDLSLDPCEYNNLAEAYPEVVQQMVATLDNYQRKATPALITDDNQLPFETIDPHRACDSQFWCPFQEYHDVDFENVLTDSYQRLYPEEMEEYVPVMINVGKQESVPFGMLLVVLVVLFVLGICMVVYVNLTNSASGDGTFYSKLMAKYNYHSTSINLRNETQPLLA
eukprot:CAMPEP_0197053618 /NCGR_PEP_ID=MMETSP1384-20130603/27844_1 /TAXON_ID=29189 /ORGANISM="Ammonia sp." /LENGTH=667 /DNA_ID=CAMNT_0042486549 /DNA_START=2482 /DNA_END=4485 /DNA_ORIENTATION=-